MFSTKRTRVNTRILNRYDMVLSTERIDLHPDCPVVYLSEIFDEMEISRKIEHVQFLSRGKIKVKSGLNSLIATMLEPEMFFLLPAGISFSEALVSMLESLLREEIVDDDFCRIMLEREQKVTMLFDENIGFPHILYEGKKLIFSIGVTGLESSRNGLRVVFLLGLPKNMDYDDQILMRIYNEIISIAGNSAIVQGIS